MSGKLLAGAAIALALSACTTTRYTIVPLETHGAQVSFHNGRPTTDLELCNGAVQVTPLGVEVNGRISFAVAGYNKLDEPVDFGSENFSARVGGVWVPVRKRGQVHFEQCSTGCPGTGRATRRGGPGPRREVNPGPVCLAIST